LKCVRIFEAEAEHAVEADMRDPDAGINGDLTIYLESGYVVAIAG